jgi:hypothetical protein
VGKKRRPYGGWPSDFLSLAAQLLCAVLLIPSVVSAQAWLFPKGEGTVSLSYQDILVTDHAYEKSDAHDIGHILSHALTLDVDYSLTDKLGVRVLLPYIVGRYYGPKPHQLPMDDGNYHSTFQDFTTDIRYNLTKRRIVLTPFFRAVIPSNTYTYFAHSAAGRDLREYHIGTNVGRRLDPFLPRAYVQAQYSYAFVERVLGIAPNRSNLEIQLGYFVTPRFSLLGTGQGMYTHGGVNLDFNLFHAGLPGDQWTHHDQIARSSLVDLGGGASFAFTQTWQMFLTVAHSIEGRNGHLHGAVVTMGVSRLFGTRQAVERASLGAGGDAVPTADRPVVCTCSRTR